MTISRREMLGLVFGGTVAAACRVESPGVPGTLRGASADLGHRLRNAVVEQASGRPNLADVVIVGGGVSGLVAARALLRSGVRDLILLELEGSAGGTACYGTDAVVPYPWGAHYLPLPHPTNRPLWEFVSEIGGGESGALGASPLREGWLVRPLEERLFFGGRWYEGLLPEALLGHEGKAELARFQSLVDGWIRWRDGSGRRAFTVPMRHGSLDAEVLELDRISAAEWLKRHGLSAPLLRWYVDYACRDDYGTRAEETSAWAMLYYFAARTPEVGQPSAPFLTWPEGNGYLVRHLEKPLGPRLRVGSVVTDVVQESERVLVSAFEPSRGALELYSAKYVIVAVPQFVAAKILRSWRESRPDHVGAFSYSPWLVANLHMKDRVLGTGAPEAWDNVLHDSLGLGYVVATHQRLQDRGPTVWTYYSALAGPDPDAKRRELLAADHASLSQGIVADLERAGSVRGVLERLDVWRWGHAMVRPTPGFIWGPARRRASLPWGRVFFAHSDLSGMALFEEAFDRGHETALAVLDRLRNEQTPRRRHLGP